MNGMRAENRKPGMAINPRDAVLQLIDQGLLESASALLVQHGIILSTPELTQRIDCCLKHGKTSKDDGDIQASMQYQRRAAALTVLRDAGHLSWAIIPSVVLPGGYRGKIMLASVEGDLIPRRTFLRSGDDWHREILRSFEEEVSDYGFEKFHIAPRGGAFAEFRRDGTIVLFGSSEEFGRCDLEEARLLVLTVFPDRDIHWSGVAE